MRFSDIISLAKEYLVMGIVAGTVLAVLFCIGYLLLYKKLMKGTNTLPKRTLALSVISVCYIVAVLGVVFLNRGNYYMSYNLQPFNAYMEAWDDWSVSGWRNIILNISLFIPFGFLLPLWNVKFQKAWRTVVCGFVFSFIIELVQLITLLGVFDVDDLMDNTFGVLVGYGYGMLFQTLVHKKRMPAKRLIWSITPTLIMILTIISIFTAYSIKELGNLSSTYSSKINMKRISLSSEVKYSDKTDTASIYKAVIGTEQDAKELAKTFFAKIGTTIDKTKSNIYDESALYYANGRNMNIWVRYKGMTYSYTDFSDNDAEQVVDADEATIRAALAVFNINLPGALAFEVTKDGSYTFTADMIPLGDRILNGFFHVSITTTALSKGLIIT